MFNPLYPRPQLVRQEWSSLDGSWSYSFSETPDPLQVNWQGHIQVPYPPEAPCSGVGDPSFHPVVWYRRSFAVPEEWRGQRILLHFGAVDYFARVWVNGKLVVEHEGGHTPFSADITHVLVPGEQEVLVRAADDPLDMEKPRGKQDWLPEPHAIWYPRTSGIWQPVWLEPVSRRSLARLRLAPDMPAFGIHFDAELTLDSAPLDDLTLDVQLKLDDILLVQASYPVSGSQVTGMLSLPKPHSQEAQRALLWSPENPVLFDLTFSLRQGGQVLDSVESYAGLRSVEVCDGEFYLNGEPYFLQMVLDQGYWADTLLAAPSPDALRQDVELTKALGFNGARKHQKIEDPRYLYWADRLGLVVWGEMPSAYTFSYKTVRRLSAELIALIERDYNHPSIVAWVPFNESWGIPDVRVSEPQRHLAEALYHLAKSLDPTRLVVDNDGWEHTRTDLLTVHDYNNQPEVFRHRYSSLDCLSDALDHNKVQILPGYSRQDAPIILSEFGGIKLGGGEGWGYQRVDTAEEFLHRFAPLMRTVYGDALSGYCYTQLTDTFQEANGLLTMERKPKIKPEIIAGILRQGLEERRARQVKPVLLPA